MTEFGPVCTLLKRAESLSLVIHQQPDGDALGSAAALYRSLSPTKSVEIVCATTVPQIFTPLLGSLKIDSHLSSTTKVIVLLDCAQWHRTGFEKGLAEARKAKRKIIAFDHHPNGSINKYVDAAVHRAEASSTAELLYQCLQELRLPLTREIADSLLLGIYTDTGGFRHANTSSKTLRIASRLISSGADLERLHRTFDQHRTLKKMRLWGAVFSGVVINQFGVAVAKIDRQTLERSGASIDDAAGLANNLALLQEARAAVILVETDRGWRTSVRTRHANVDVRRLVKYFGGRGTQKASGFLATNDLVSGKIG